MVANEARLRQELPSNMSSSPMIWYAAWASPCLVDDACAQHIKSPPPFSHRDMNWKNKLLITLFFT
jgi:hypothetical protein